MSKSIIQENIDIVTLEIKIDGAVIPDTVQVRAVVVRKEVNRLGMARLVILEPYSDRETFTVSNMDEFIPGKEIEIKAGYHSDNNTIFKGVIIKHGVKMAGNEPSQLLVECRDMAAKLTIARRSQYFYELKDSAVMEEIIGTYSGIRAEVDTTNKTHQEMVQYDATDWDFILSRAEANGMLAFNDDGTLAIKAPDFAQSPEYRATYGVDMLAFNAEMDARTQFDQVKSQAWDFGNQQLVEGASSSSEVPENGNIPAETLAKVFGEPSYDMLNGGQTDTEEMQTWADAKMLKSRLAKNRGRIKTYGVADLKPGQLLELAGVGERFDGNVFVSGVSHQITEGIWSTDIQFGMDPEWFANSYEISQTPASALLPAVSGLQLGIVTQLENDPDGEDRIRVRLPMIDRNGDGVWARIAAFDAGNNRGAFFRPELDDEVIVGFVNDDPREAVVLGMLNSSAKPAPLQATDDNHVKGLVTRSGIKLLFDDDQKILKMQTPNGNEIHLDENDGSVLIKDQNDNSIKMDSAGITLESQTDLTLKANGDIKVEGLNVELFANAQFKAEGSAQAELTASGQTKVTGSIVMIN